MENLIDKDQLEIIEKTLQRGDRIELIPTKNCVKLYVVKRKEIRSTKNQINPT